MELDTQNYYAFVLGYDFWNDIFKDSSSPECDVTYEFCNKVASDYLKSEYFKNTNYTGYEMFEKYITDNRFQILKEYEKFIGEENIYFKGNKKLLAVGTRKNQPVALVEWTKGGRKEYIVAFDYIIDKENSSLSWGYGKYYYDKNSGKSAYEKVINGGNLTHTFDKGQER